MGAGGTRCHHHPVDLLFQDDFFNLFLGILGTGEQVVFHMDYIGQGGGIIPHRRHIGNAPDVNPAIAYKDTDARSHTGKIAFRWQFPGSGEGPALL